jgi:heme oxygenase
MNNDSIMLMLRDRTAELHGIAEKQPFQRALICGEITREGYAAYLGQMFVIHSSLEAGLARCSEPVVQRIVTGEQFQAGNLKSDLAVLGDFATPQATPAALMLTEAIDASHDAASLLGHLYVLEGSKNGNAFVARAIRRALNLTAGTGDRYLDPHGPEQRPIWAAFKARMDGEQWTSQQRDDMLAAARMMFSAIVDLSSELEVVRQRHAIPTNDIPLNLTR